MRTSPIQPASLTSLFTIGFISFIGFCGSSGCTSSNTLQPLQQQPTPAIPQTTSLQISNYVPSAGNTFSDIFVSNFSMKNAMGQLSYSTARDGMTDTYKQANGLTVNTPYLSPNTLSDLVFSLAGLSFFDQSNTICSTNQNSSTYGDVFSFFDKRFAPAVTVYLGLRDCEKTFLGLNVNTFDSSGNGIPDYLKLRCGLNPTNANDTFLSFAADSVSNINKCKQNIPLDESANSPSNQLYGYTYNSVNNGDGSLTFNIGNIPVADSGVQNFLAIYITEFIGSGSANKQRALYTGYIIPTASVVGKVLKVPYWVTACTSSTYLNQDLTSKVVAQ